MADNPLTDDLVAADSHGGPSADSAPLATDLAMTLQQQQQQQLEAKGVLSRTWTNLYNKANPPTPPPSQTPVSDIAKDVAGSVARGSAGTMDYLLNPSQMVLRPLTVAGTSAWDFLAPKVGLPQLTPEQRADLLNEPGEATRALSQIPGPNPMTTPPQTPIGQKLDVPIQSAVGAAAMGPGGLLRRAGIGAVGGAAGDQAANMVDARYAPLVGLATNALVQGAAQGALPKPGASMDAAQAAIAQRSQQQFGIPFRAPDLVPNSQLRSPAHVQDLNDALRGNIVSEMGEDPNTGYTPTTNKVTPQVLDDTRTRTGQVFDGIGQNNDIQAGPAFALLTRLRQIDNDIDNVTGVSANDRSIMRARLGEVRNAINRTNGTMSGTDYLGLTQSGSRLDKLAGDGNSGIANIGMQTVDALHSAMNNSLSPQDQAALTQARYQWRLMKTMEPLVASDRTGNIDPGQFADRVADQSNLLDTGGRKTAYGGGGAIGGLADAARLISQGAPAKSLNPLPTMITPTGMLPYLLGRPAHEALAAQVLPSLLQGASATVMRSPSYARQAFGNAVSPPRPVDYAAQGLLAGALTP